VLLEDETRRKQLEDKLAEYRQRAMHKDVVFLAPEQKQGILCKIEVLAELLRKGKVQTREFGRQLAKKYGSGFDFRACNTAFGVIDDYCKTGGANVVGGTGLRTPEEVRNPVDSERQQKAELTSEERSRR